MMHGANLTGGDSYYAQWNGGTPVSGTHYKFVTPADVDLLVARGFDTFRLVFAWEAIQPVPFGIIGSGVYFKTFKALVDYITNTKGATVILDIHGGADATFAAYYGNKVGSTYLGYGVSNLLVDFWTKMADIFKTNGLVRFGITNEPHDIPTSTWFSCAQRVHDAIRKTGATNWIDMPGAAWTGAGTWVSSGNAAGWNLVDPLKRTTVQVHLYLDMNSGGGADDIVDAMIGVTRLMGVVGWARSKGLKVFIGEIGFSAGSPLAAAAWKNLTDYFAANSDVIVGWTFWAYGPFSWWSSYRFTLDGDSPQLNLIAPKDPTATLKAEIASLVDDRNTLRADLGVAAARVAQLTSDIQMTTTALNDTSGKYNKLVAVMRGVQDDLRAALP